VVGVMVGVMVGMTGVSFYVLSTYIALSLSAFNRFRILQTSVLHFS
jgi:hypothetical protein